MNDQAAGAGTQSGIPNSGSEGGAAGGAGAAGAGGAAGGAAGAAGEAKPFYDGWEPDLRANQSIVNAKDPQAIARMYLDAEKRLGVPPDQLVRLPTKPDDKEALGAIYSKLGAPDKPEGYKIELGDQATEADKARGGRFAKTMFEAGPFPATMVETALNFWKAEIAAEDASLVEASKTAVTDAETSLKKEWGAAYAENSKAVGEAVTKYGGPELEKELFAGQMGNSPALARMLAKMISQMGEGTGSGSGNPDTGARAMTPDQAKAARLTLENDPQQSKILRDGSHPQHKAIVQQRDRLLAYENGRDYTPPS